MKNFMYFAFLLCITFNTFNSTTNTNSNTNTNTIKTSITNKAYHINLSQNKFGLDLFKSGYNKSHPNITAVNKVFTLDKQLNSCNVFITEEVTFNLSQPSNYLNYIIISKSNIYGIKVTLPFDSPYNILKTSIYNNKNLKQNFVKFQQNDISIMSNFFNNRLLISTLLNKKVKKISLIFHYYISGTIQTESKTNGKGNNIMTLHMINPFPYQINNLNIQLNLQNFTNLKRSDINIPETSNIEVVNGNKNGISTAKDYKITFNNKVLPVHSEFFMKVSLPLKIFSCEVIFYGVVMYMFLTVALFTFIFLLFYYIYKN